MRLKSLVTRHRVLARLALALAIGLPLAMGGCAALQHEERELTFRAIREAASWYSGLPEGVREVDIPVASDGGKAKIHGWWWPAERADAPAVLYLHGARWNLTGHVYRLEQLREFGFSVFAIDYRGFGESDGDLPSEDTVYQDAHAAWQWLITQQPDAHRRFIYGHSLGGAVAIDLAASLGPAEATSGLIVESTFTTLADIAAELSSRWLPLSLILSQKFDSLDKMARVHAPVLVVHGEADRYVPFRFSKALFAAAPAPKRLLLVEGAGHNNSMFAGEDRYRESLFELFGIDTREPSLTRAGSARSRPGRPVKSRG